MLCNARDSEKFLKKLSADAASFHVQINTEGNLVFDGTKKVCITDFLVVHDGKLWGRAGMTWLPSTPLPEVSVPICTFSLKRLAVFSENGTVDCISPKKEIDSGTSFLLCAKFPAGIRLLIADASVGKHHIALTLYRDENGEAFCQALIRQFVQHRLPEQITALDVLMEGGDA